jgi:hypothetical protein
MRKFIKLLLQFTEFTIYQTVQGSHGRWYTSIPRIIVGIFDTRGIAGFVSIGSNEFIPPS